MNTELDNQSLSLIEEHVRRLLVIMGFTDIVVRCRHLIKNNPDTEDYSGTLHISLEAGGEGNLLIGTQGYHLSALQHLIRSVLRRQLARPLYVVVDVNGYRARRERSLFNLAEAAARRAKTQGRTVVLQPMEAFERRTIHAALSSRDDIKTESMGNEPNRRVIIKPVFL
ncbi:MAG: R3H domain-containing nucleic acid-binding protein [bacterium]|nr:R3H domain-containing nucleic acid-binding protein [bacterium]MDZ4344133.1 R3H domain-containing nucleic acid-binding protein [Candidatus Binatia bacterium]